MRRAWVAIIAIVGAVLLVACGSVGHPARGNVVPPAISHVTPHRVGGPPPGAPAVGDILFAGNGQWSGSPTGFTYQWDDCDSGGANCSAAAGSPNNVQRYVVASGDVGSTIRVAVTAAYSGHPSSTVLSAPTGVVTGSGVFPLQVSGNGRYLEDTNGNPWLLVGDSPQSTIGNLTLTHADSYLDDRESHGFDAVWFNVPCDDYTYCNANGTTDSSTEVGSIAPFTSGSGPSSYTFGSGECGNCNSTYWSRAHSIIAHAQADNIEVLLDPMETGGWTTMANNSSNGDGTVSTTDGDYRYGEFIGDEFKDLHNIIFLFGNDFQNVSTNPDSNNIKSIANGVAAKDPSAINTLESDFDGFLTSDSLVDVNGSDTTWDSFVQANAVYTYAPAYVGVRAAYSQAAIPSFLVESNYDGEANGSFDGCNFNSDAGDGRNCRLQEWWTMTSGATGQLYGCNCTTHLTNANYPNSMDTGPVTELGYVTSLMKSIAWQNLKPDTSSSVVLSGSGTCRNLAYLSSPGVTTITNDTCVTTASDYSGTDTATESVSYLPDPSSYASPVVNMAAFAGPVTAQWYDPTNGSYTAVPGTQPFANMGTRTFTPSTTNSAGDKDWVLLLTAAPTTFNVSCGLTFAAGSTGSNSSSPIANDGSGGTCWGQQTGVYAGTGDTEAQIEANPTGLGFTHHTGDLTITTSGTTINKYWVDGGCIEINSGVNNVTIENTLVTDSVPDCTLSNESGGGIHAGGNPPTSTGTLVKYTTIDGAPSGDSGSDTSGLILDDGTAIANNIFGFTKGLVSDLNDEANPQLFQDNYVHDFQDCSHDDGTWEDGFGYVDFQHNWVYTNDPADPGATGGTCATGACVGGSDVGSSGGNVEHDTIYNENFCSGFDGEDGQTGCGGYDIHLTNNVLDNTAVKFDAYGGFNSPDFQDSWSSNQQINHSGTLSSASDPSSGICSGASSNSVAPSISGTATHGDTLTAAHGTWSNTPTYAYQWFDCDTSGANCVPISGATSSTYVLATSDEGHTVRVLVIATASSSVNQSVKPSAATATVN